MLKIIFEYTQSQPQAAPVAMQVVTQQPMAMAMTTWSRTICGPGCLGDCCYASWCTCCAAQQIADSMGDRKVLLKTTVCGFSSSSWLKLESKLNINLIKVEGSGSFCTFAFRLRVSASRSHYEVLWKRDSISPVSLGQNLSNVLAQQKQFLIYWFRPWRMLSSFLVYDLRSGTNVKRKPYSTSAWSSDDATKR